MSDTLHSQTLLPPAVLADARAPKRQDYLFNPWFDFFCLGGGSVVILCAIALLLPKGIPTAEQATLIAVLMLLINQPHFAHSYQIFYRGFREKAFGESYKPALRARYIVAGIAVPFGLFAFFAAALLGDNARLLGYGANLMFFLVGWHYVKQGYGILMVDSVKKRVFFSDAAKTIFRVNGYASWIVAWLALNHAVARGEPYLGLKYYTFDLPSPLYIAACAFAALTGVAALLALAQAGRKTGGRLPWNGVVAYLTTLYLWVIFVRINPLILVVVPTFHSLQYQAVVWRYQWNAARGRETGTARRPAAWRHFALFTAAGLALGYLGFTGLPDYFNAHVAYDHHLFGPTLFTFLFYIFINVHHYFLDNVMWRRENPDVRKYIFSA